MIASSECDHLIQAAEKERIGRNGERADFLLDESRKGNLQVAIGGGSEHNDRLVESARCGLHVIRLVLGIGIVRVQKDCDHTRFRDHFAQQLQPLMFERNLEEVNACDIAAGPVVAGNKTELDRVATFTKTMGIVEVAALAATAETTPPDAKITATRRQNRSFADSISRSK
jgi:hypothetical protein